MVPSLSITWSLSEGENILIIKKLIKEDRVICIWANLVHILRRPILAISNTTTTEGPPDGARRPETERPCAGRVFPCAPGSTPGGAGVAVFLPPFQANPQAPSSLIYGVLFPPPQFLFL